MVYAVLSHKNPKLKKYTIMNGVYIRNANRFRIIVGVVKPCKILTTYMTRIDT